MSTFQFILEGKEDVKFLQDVISDLGFVQRPMRFEYSGGWTKINYPAIVNKLKENTLKNGRNIVIFDADDDYVQRRTYLEDQRRLLGVKYDFFLFPNNAGVGDLETILLRIANPLNNSIFKCFDTYRACINTNYTPPSQKDKIFAYLDALNKETRVEKRNFLDTDCWDISHSYLQTLREFLTQILQ